VICYEPPAELDDVRAGRLPPRYGWRMQDFLLMHARPLLVPGVRVLDVGGGRHPTIPVALRPHGTRYTGLDAAPGELAAAPAGSYDATIVHDITAPLPAGPPYDLIVSWQVLEHVSSLPRALGHLRAALRPGGALVAQVSGAFAFFALAARALPHAARVRLMRRLLGSPAEEKFPTHYDRCWASALDRALAGWSWHALHPHYRGASYLTMSRAATRLYLAYEDVVARMAVRNLATHYLVLATR
jgi:SAM-dependent methyltransferase